MPQHLTKILVIGLISSNAMAVWPNYVTLPSRVPHEQPASVPLLTHDPGAYPAAVQQCKSWQQSFNNGNPVPGTTSEVPSGRRCRDMDLD